MLGEKGSEVVSSRAPEAIFLSFGTESSNTRKAEHPFLRFVGIAEKCGYRAREVYYFGLSTPNLPGRPLIFLYQQQSRM
jgi:hypothetical protein